MRPITSPETAEAIARLAHDVRTPLGIIVAYAELLTAEKPGPLNQKQHRYVASIRAAAETITDQLLSAEAETRE